jgi:hypothetical protein
MTTADGPFSGSSSSPLSTLLPADTSRRRFLHQATGASLALGASPWLAGCMGGGESSAGSLTSKPREKRSYLFNLSNAKVAAEYFLVAGTRHHKLVRANTSHLEALRQANPSLSLSSLTHVAEDVELTSAGPQLCFIKGVSGPGAADWQMHGLFYHLPAAAATLRPPILCVNPVSCPVNTLGADPGPAATNYCTDPRFDGYKDYFDHAVALISNHPEIGTFDTTSLSYIQQNIICTDANTFNLAGSLFQQGPATSTGGWATLKPYIDPDTKLPHIDANGQTVCYTTYSPTTLLLLGRAINSILPKVKNDPGLGADITGLPTNASNASLQGKAWVVRDGNSSAPGTSPAMARLSRSLPGDSEPAFTKTDVSTGNGFDITDFSYSGRTATFTVNNWYLRYLGLYARFLDGNRNPIDLSTLPGNITNQFQHANLNGQYDAFISLINQELVILGIPVNQSSQTFNLTIPDSAAYVELLAGGLGHGTKTYPSTTLPGAVMTTVLDLALPGVFLTMGAAQGFASLSTTLSTSTKLLISSAQIFIQSITDAGLVGSFGDQKTFSNLLQPIAITLIKNVPALNVLITEALAQGQAEGAAEDCIPFGIGLIIQAIVALATAAQIIETSAEVANAPWTFVTELSLTHSLTVTINHDPADTAGFPATATHYQLSAICNDGSPRDSGLIAMPATTQTLPLSYTFDSLPSGGNVNISVVFLSANNWIAGAGTTGPISNINDSASITITEKLVPLSSTTLYSHKQKTALDVNGRRVWQASTVKPSAPPLSCSNVAGSLCTLVGITLSEPFGAIGYAWQASSTGVTSFGNGATGQLSQFANISFTSDPQSGYMSSGKGFPTPARLAYDRSSTSSKSYYIDTSSGKNMVRRVQMAGVGLPPAFDTPDSGLSVGAFNFASDAFLIHPTGVLVSFNSSASKMEVLQPSATAVSDSLAPVAQAYSGPGSRQGLLSGPVCAAVTQTGEILVIESGNNRIQAFDTGANPSRWFNNSHFMALKPRASVTYLDIAVEFTGFIYVLLLDGSTSSFALDIYDKSGAWLCTTDDMRASKLAIDLFRNTYTLNFETLGANGYIEPTISEWIPSTPLSTTSSAA